MNSFFGMCPILASQSMQYLWKIFLCNIFKMLEIVQVSFFRAVLWIYTKFNMLAAWRFTWWIYLYDLETLRSQTTGVDQMQEGPIFCLLFHLNLFSCITYWILLWVVLFVFSQMKCKQSPKSDHFMDFEIALINIDLNYIYIYIYITSLSKWIYIIRGI